MNNLLKKYLSERISREELEGIRQIPEHELSESLKEDWDRFFITSESEHKKSKWKKVLLSSAAVLFSILMFSTILLWNRTDILSSQDIVVTTGGSGERASITLPDGSVISLNSNSSLSYKPEDFIGDTRSVTFEGEGFFTIVKSDKKKFIVRTSLVSVNVKGTVFNLLSREKDRSASLYLESGSVEFTSVASGNSIEMKPGEFASLDADGLGFTREENKNSNLITAWKQGEFIFINQNLKEIAKYLEYNFNTKIEFENSDVGNIPFTGTLPNSNLPEAIEILELSCGLQCTQKGNVILLNIR